jgi:hypothetical protein
MHANFSEPRKAEVRRISLLSTTLQPAEKVSAHGEYLSLIGANAASIQVSCCWLSTGGIKMHASE